LHANVTVTRVSFQPAAFGSGVRLAVIAGSRTGSGSTDSHGC
jgi:hypothetical protein